MIKKNHLLLRMTIALRLAQKRVVMAHTSMSQFHVGQMLTAAYA